MSFTASGYTSLINSLGADLYWPLNDEDGAEDASGNGNDGVVGGDITPGGYVGGALGFDSHATEFDGVDDRIGSSYVPFVNAAEQSFTLWARRDDADADYTLFAGTDSDAPALYVARDATNRQSNPGFENTTITTVWEGFGGTLSKDTTTFRSGAAAAKLLTTGAGFPSVNSTQTAGRFAVTVGESISASVQVKAGTTARNMVCAIKWFNSGGSAISTTTGASTPISLSAWTQLSVSGTAPTGAVTAAILAYVNSTPPASEAYYVDEAMAVLGDMPTYFFTGASAGDVVWMASGDATPVIWSGAFPAAGGDFAFVALVVDDPGNEVTLYVDGSLVSVKATTDQYGSSPGAFTAGAVSAAGGSGGGSVIRSADIETNLTEWDYTTDYFGTGAAVARVTDRVYQGVGAMKHTIGALGGTDGIARASWFKPPGAVTETNTFAVEGDELWCAAAIWFDSAETHPYTQFIRFSDHNTGLPTSNISLVFSMVPTPLLHVSVQDYGGGSSGVADYRPITLVPMPQDRWVLVEMGALCSSNPATGWVEVWIDGQRAAQADGRTVKVAGQQWRRIQVGFGSVYSEASSIHMWVDAVTLADGGPVTGTPTAPLDGELGHVAAFPEALSALSISSLYRGVTAVVNELPPDDAALYVENPDGSERRIAGDEPSLPLSDYTIATTLPGGFATADGDATLPPQGISELTKFSRVAVRLGDRTTLWEGRLESTPQRTEDGTLGISAVGHQALLEDNPAVVFLGVDNDMSAWEDPPGDYIESQAGSHSVNTRFTVSSSENALTIRMEGDTNVAGTAYGIAWYLPPMGTAIGTTIQYVASEDHPGDMALQIATSTEREDDTILSSDTVNTSGLSVKTFTSTTGGLSARVRDTPTTNPVNHITRNVRFYAISVYGDHGLTLRDVADGIPQGLYFSDIIGYLIDTYAPLISTMKNGASTIEQSTYAMASAVWPDPTTLGGIIEDGIVFEPHKDWAIWEGPTFHYATRTDMGRVWTVRRSEGASFHDLGETSEPDYNGVIVTFTDKDGATKRAGPVGSGANREDASLSDPDPDNPVTASSVVGNRYLLVDIGDGDADTAVNVGQVALAEALRRRFSGEVEMPRYAECEGQILPTSLVRAGDKIIDGDAAGGEQMPLVGTSYQRSSERPLTATVDMPANRLDSALARLEARPRRLDKGAIRHRLEKQAKRRARHHRQRVKHRHRVQAMRQRQQERRHQQHVKERRQNRKGRGPKG